MNGERFDSVWDALEDTPALAVHMRARFDIMIAIREVIDGWGITQTAAAARLGITRPRLNDLRCDQIDKLSVDALLALVTTAGVSGAAA